MSFINFDPLNWTDKDLDKLIKLWIEFESIVKSCKSVNEKIKDANIKNDSLKNEIQSSTDRCNEIIENENYISIESAEEIVQLSKNIKEVRKQEDIFENQIAKYKDELVELRTKRDNIVKEINELSLQVQGNILNNNLEVNGNVKIEDVPSLDNIDVKINTKYDAIISTIKPALVTLRSTFKDTIGKIVTMPDFVIDKINNSTNLFNAIKELTEELKKSQEEIQKRKKNHEASLEAAKLSIKTDEELLNSHSEIRMDYINNGEQIAPEETKEEPIEESKEDTKEAAIAYDNVKDNLNALDKINPLELRDEKDSKELKDEIIKRTTEISDSKEKLSDSTLKAIEQEEKEKLLKEEESVIPLSPLSDLPMGITGENKVEPIQITQSDTQYVDASNQESKSLGEKANIKLNTVAQTNNKKEINIHDTFKRKVLSEEVRRVENDSNLPTFSLKGLESVSKFLTTCKYKQIKDDMQDESISNIFGSSNDVVQPLKL